MNNLVKKRRVKNKPVFFFEILKGIRNFLRIIIVYVKLCELYTSFENLKRSEYG